MDWVGWAMGKGSLIFSTCKWEIKIPVPLRVVVRVINDVDLVFNPVPDIQ